MDGGLAGAVVSDLPKPRSPELGRKVDHRPGTAERESAAEPPRRDTAMAGTSGSARGSGESAGGPRPAHRLRAVGTPSVASIWRGDGTGLLGAGAGLRSAAPSGGGVLRSIVATLRPHCVPRRRTETTPKTQPLKGDISSWVKQGTFLMGSDTRANSICFDLMRISTLVGCVSSCSTPLPHLLKLSGATASLRGCDSDVALGG